MDAKGFIKQDTKPAEKKVEAVEKPKPEIDYRSLERTVETLEKLVNTLEYYLSKMDKRYKNDLNYKNCLKTTDEIKRILDLGFSDARRISRTRLNEEIDNKYIAQLSETNSPKPEAIKRIGKLLGIRKAFMEGVIKTAVAKHEKIRRASTENSTKS